MALVLGIDVGTSQLKALALDDSGQVRGLTSVKYDITSPHPGWAEQDPQDWWQAICQAVQELLPARERGDVRGLALSTQGADTVLCVDREENPIGPAITWLDTRASAESDELNRELGGKFWYRKTGKGISPNSTPPKIRWLRENQPQSFAQILRVCFAHDYLAYRLTGRYVLDLPNAVWSSLFDISEHRWESKILEAVGVNLQQLSQVKPSGEVVGRLTSQAADALGLSPDVVMAVGAHDQPAAALGAGAWEPGESLLSCGTAWVLFVVLDQLRFDPQMRLALGCHALPDRWDLIAAFSGGVVWDWFQESWRGNQDSSEPVEAPPLIFLPYLYGAGSPAGDQQARGALIGLTLDHRPQHLEQAIMEALAFQTQWNREVAESLGAKFSQVRMVGGAAKSERWPQILADVLNLPVEIPPVTEAAALGAALLAAQALGWLVDREFLKAEGEGQRFLPDPDQTAKYAQQYHIYRNAFEALRSIYQNWNESPSDERKQER